MTKITKLIDRIYELREKVAWRELTVWERETLIVKELDEIHKELKELKEEGGI